MRAPRPPKKPRRIAAAPAERDGGGELVQGTPSPQDYVPTAPMAPLDEELLENASADHPVSDGGDGREVATQAVAPRAGCDNGEETSWPTARLEPAEEPEKTGLLARGVSLGSRARAAVLGVASRTSRTQAGELDARRVERRQEVRRIRVKRLGIAAGVVAVIAFVGWIVLGSPLLRYQFAPEQITGYSASSIVDRAKLEALLAEHSGDNLLLLNTDALEHEITAALPEVAGVNITKEYRHSLKIAITEAVPVACLGSKDACRAVTAEGKELNIPAEKAASLPRISQTGVEPARAISHALTVLGALQQGVLDQVAEVAVAKGDLLTLKLADGRTVYWGGSERASFKAAVLAVLLTQPARYFDVSVPDAPVSR
ncbi:cell division protein FtsQ/DivIB [Trueperella pyogenes]|uniref:cell division protein FtsQ/DivIB n=1 Tax=Trueperella pyogenes TaxID=1661 RepID=UPI0024C05D05|nr:FtsQ-type POTRA domain-containing protein [Trueperella pyogenes]WHU56896.1 cell division protein FtsQ/DivIB [Trueperella pyogenes]